MSFSEATGAVKTDGKSSHYLEETGQYLNWQTVFSSEFLLPGDLNTNLGLVFVEIDGRKMYEVKVIAGGQQVGKVLVRINPGVLLGENILRSEAEDLRDQVRVAIEESSGAGRVVVIERIDQDIEEIDKDKETGRKVDEYDWESWGEKEKESEKLVSPFEIMRSFIHERYPGLDVDNSIEQIFRVFVRSKPKKIVVECWIDWLTQSQVPAFHEKLIQAIEKAKKTGETQGWSSAGNEK